MSMRFTRLCCALALVAAAACASKKKSEEPAEPESTPSKSPAPAASPAARPIDPPRTNDNDTVDGYRLIQARGKNGDITSVTVKPPKGWDVVAPPTEPDPQAGKFNLAQATQGLPKQGVLAAQIKTSLGSFYCDLLADKAPNTVANFVGLARGKRKFWDAEKLAWVTRNYYDGTTFHRVIPGFMIQGGDHTGTGRGMI